jgi:hypothetical protein
MVSKKASGRHPSRPAICPPPMPQEGAGPPSRAPEPIKAVDDPSEAPRRLGDAGHLGPGEHLSEGESDVICVQEAKEDVRKLQESAVAICLLVERLGKKKVRVKDRVMFGRGVEDLIRGVQNAIWATGEDKPR